MFLPPHAATLLRAALLFALSAPAILTAAIQWTGISQLPKDEIRFSLVDTKTETRSKWIPLGGVFGDYVLTAFDSENEVLVLKNKDETLRLKLQPAVIQEQKEPVQPPSSQAMTDEQEPVHPPSSQAMTDEQLRSHGLRRITRGDTISKIARDLGLRVSELLALNPEVRPTELRVGQILRVRPDPDGGK